MIMAHNNPLLDLLHNLPPSQEVLELYRAKVSSWEQEELKWLEKLSHHRGLVNRLVELEGVISDKDRELRLLQKAVVDLQAAIGHERKRTVKLQTENDKLKIRDSESRRKIHILLEMTGKRDAELTEMIREADNKEKESDTSESRVYIPDNLKRYIKDSKKFGKKSRWPRDPESLKIEIATLEYQLAEQERCHLEQISTLENERRFRDKEAEALQDTFKAKIKELAVHIQSMDKVHEDLTADLVKSRSHLHKKERQWLAEKETLFRKIQFVQHFGGGKGSGENAGGFNTDQRAGMRSGGDLKTKKTIQKLNSELADQKAMAASFKTQILSMEAEMDKLRDQNEASSEVIKRRTKAMAERMESMRDQYESMKQRKKTEIEGYQSDIKILKQKTKKIEQDLVRSALSRVKEHDYIKAIKAYERELDDLKTAVKNSGIWLS